MIKKRIIPKILLDSSKISNRVVTGSSIKYKDFRVVGAPESQAGIFQATTSDELIVVARRNSNIDFESCVESLNKINQRVLMPVSFGGNISEIKQVHQLFDLGIEKVIFGRALYRNHELILQTANLYGSQAVIVSIDCYGLIPTNESSEPFDETKTLESVVRHAEESGAGELCLNDIQLDGSKSGTNLRLLSQARASTDLPLIQSCGVGKTSHFIEAFEHGADAIAVGTYFAFVDQNFVQIRSHIRNSGIDIRN